MSEKTGTENYSYHVIRHLLQVPETSQHKFVLFIRPKAQIPGWTRQKNVIIQPIKFRFLWTQVGLARETWRTKLDLLWVPAHTLPVLRNPRVRTVVTIHGLEYQWLPEYRNWLQKWYLPLSTWYVARKASQLIAVSRFTRDQLIKELQTDPKKIKVVYEGVERDDRFQKLDVEAALERYGLQREKYLLFVGTIQPRKNLVALIEAFSLVAIRLPAYKLVIAGGVGWMADEVLRAPSRWGIQDRVVLTGRVDEMTLSALYQGAGVYIQPSWTEGFGLPVLEAMAQGVAVITSNGGALEEVVGKAGVVVPLGEQFVNELATAIERACRDMKLREQLMKAGKVRAKQLTWVQTAQATWKVLKTVLY